MARIAAAFRFPCIDSRIARYILLGAFILSACTPQTQPQVVSPSETPAAKQAAQINTPAAAAPTRKPEPTRVVPVFDIPEDTPVFVLNDKVIQSKEIPADVIEEMMFMGIGGQLGAGCQYSMDIEIVGVKEIDVLDLTPWPILLTCGWEDGESLTITMVYPDGHEEVINVVAHGSEGGSGGASISPPRGPGTQLGTYTLNIKGSDQSVSGTFTMVLPRNLSLFPVDKKQLIFGAKPNEHIRALVYQLKDVSYAQLTGWYDFSVDANGSALVDIQLDEQKYHVLFLGDESGEIIHPLNNIKSLRKEYYQKLVENFSCPEAPPTRLSLWTHARVTFTDGTPTTMRMLPGKKQFRMADLPEGTDFLIIDGPSCVDNYVWWQVRLEDGTLGWIAEGDPETYYIEPFDD